MVVYVGSSDPAVNDHLFYDKTKLDNTYCMQWAGFDLLNIKKTGAGIKEVSKEIEQMLRNKQKEWRPYFIKKTLYLATALTMTGISASIISAFKFAWTQTIYKKFHINDSNLLKGCLAAASVSVLLLGLWRVQRSKIEADVASTCLDKNWKYHNLADAIGRWINAADKRTPEIILLNERCDRLLELIKDQKQRESLTFAQKEIKTAFNQSYKTTETIKNMPPTVGNIIKLSYQDSEKKQKALSIGNNNDKLA